MLTTLIESRRRSRKSTGGTVVSVVVHATLITLVAAVTAHARDNPPGQEPPLQDVVYVALEEPSPIRTDAAPTRTQADAAPSLPQQPIRHIEVPGEIPTTFPPVDLSELTTDPSDFVIATHVDGDAGGADDPISNGRGGTFTARQVEKVTALLPGNPKPRYPSLLQSERIDGEVLAQFVVDTSGRVDMSTFRAVDATNELFVDAVRRVLVQWRFQPAEAGGRKVKQLVQMPLTFRVR
jgi:periplasmic protein TonB